MPAAVIGLVRGRVLASLLAVVALAMVAVAAVSSRGSRSAADPRGAVSNELYVPGAAHVAGAAGTNWRSDLEIYNVGTTAATYQIALLRQNRPNPAPATVSFSLGPHRAVRYGDLLDSLFHVSGSAALRITSGAGSLMANCRTYNQTNQGTYGQFISALDPAAALRVGDRGRLIQLTHSQSDTTGYRTNLGFLNLSATRYNVTVEYSLANGTVLGTGTVTLDPFEFEAVNGAFGNVTAADVSDGFVVVRALHPAALYLAYASVVDNRTGDPIYIPAQMAPAAAPSQAAAPTRPRHDEPAPAAAPKVAGTPIYIMAAAHVAGAGDTQWRTDVQVHNPGTGMAQFEIALLETGRNNSNPQTIVALVAAGRSRRFADILASQFNFTGSAALRITPLDGTVMVTSRTYNLTNNGTFGQFIGGIPAAEALTSADEAALIQLSHQNGGTGGARTNLGFVNTGSTAIVVVLEAWRANGTALGSRQWTIPPYGHLQVNRALGLLTAASVADAFGIVSTTTPGGRFLAYASVVDNDTGDPILVPAVRTTEGASQQPLEVADYMADWFGSVPGASDFPSLEAAVQDWQASGFGSLLTEIRNTDPGVVSVAGNTITADYGSGTTLPDGTVASGSLQISFTNLVNNANRVAFHVSGVAPTFQIGQLSLGIDTAQADLDLDRTPGGHLAGSLTFSLGTNKAGNTVTGNLEIDTALCERFPVGGTITYDYEGTSYTLTIPSTCDGSYAVDESPPQQCTVTTLDEVPPGSLGQWTVSDDPNLNPVFAAEEIVSPYDGTTALHTSSVGDTLMNCPTPSLGRIYNVGPGNTDSAYLEAYLEFSFDGTNYNQPMICINALDNASSVLATHCWYGRDILCGYYENNVFPTYGWQYTELPGAAGYYRLDLREFGANVSYSKLGVYLINYTCIGVNSVVFDHLVYAHDCN